MSKNTCNSLPPSSFRASEPQSRHPIPLPLSNSALRFGTVNIGCGFLRKLPTLLRRGIALSLDAIAIQEIGDPAMLRPHLHPYFLISSSGPSSHEAGVGLLIAKHLAPHCRNYLNTKHGRLVGVVLELTPNQRLLLVSAYMPSGLDHVARNDTKVAVAHSLYAEIVQWSVGMHHVIVLGDLNETLTHWDRYPHPLLHHSMSNASAPIDCLVQEGYIDVYRTLHPHARREPGFTHHVRSTARTVYSRLDYIWCKGFPSASLIRINIDLWPKLRRLSHHALLWAELLIPDSTISPNSFSLSPLPRLPNLRAASIDQRTRFVEEVHQRLNTEQSSMHSLSDSATPASLDNLATQLTSIVHQCAVRILPSIGNVPFQNKELMTLHRQRRCLTRLLHLSSTLYQASIPLHRSPEWHRLFLHCWRMYGLRWKADPYATACLDKYHIWIAETKRLLSRTRQFVRKLTRRLGREGSSTNILHSQAATVHRMLQNDAIPSQLYSVVKETGDLTASASDMQER